MAARATSITLPSSVQLPGTVKLQAAARSLGMTPKEFRALLSRKQIPVLRPSQRRERILADDYGALCASIAGPALPKNPWRS